MHGLDFGAMKVLVVHNRYRSASPSGEDRVVDQEAAALVACGHSVERFERFSDDIAGQSVLQKALLPGKVVWNDSVRRSLADVLRRFRPDVVHLHNTFPLMSPSVLYAARAERVPVVATMHHYRLVCPSGDLFRDGAVCHDCVGRLPVPAITHGCYRQSAVATVPLAVGSVVHRRAWRTMISAYVCLSHAQRDILAEDELPPERLFVKPNFVPNVSAAVSSPDDFVVYAGRLAPTKGIPVLMEAWDRYRADANDGSLRLVIAGAGPLEREVSAWASTRPSVNWVGMLSRSDCASLMAHARLAVVPSLWEETFGLVVVEAMAAGVPSVASAHGSFPELITEGVDGVLVEPADPSALARVFRDVELRPERYVALGKAARRTYERRFAPEPNLRQLLEIYQFAIDNPVSSERRLATGSAASTPGV